MPDKEKVIKGLECCSNLEDDCTDCPYDYAGDYGESFCLRRQLMPDALALLKGQEAVEPTFKQDNDGIFVWACGSCGAYMYHIYEGIDKAKEYAKYCRQCGRKVKWDA